MVYWNFKVMIIVVNKINMKILLEVLTNLG
jgi:hypothetical protein